MDTCQSTFIGKTFTMCVSPRFTIRIRTYIVAVFWAWIEILKLVRTFTIRVWGGGLYWKFETIKFTFILLFFLSINMMLNYSMVNELNDPCTEFTHVRKSQITSHRIPFSICNVQLNTSFFFCIILHSPICIAYSPTIWPFEQLVALWKTRLTWICYNWFLHHAIFSWVT